MIARSLQEELLLPAELAAPTSIIISPSGPTLEGFGRESYSSHMKRATITEAKKEPAQTMPEDDADGRLARLERAGVIRRAATPPPVARILQPLPRVRKSARVVEALIEERWRGR